MQNLVVETNQNVELEFEVAGVGDRILAYIIDILILIVLEVGLIFLVAFTSQFNGIIGTIFPFLIVLPLMFYDLLFEYFMDGQTPGKRLRKIKVVSVDGGRTSIGSYLLRWMLRIIDITIFYGIPAIITIVASEKSQRLGDMAAGTTVVKVGRDVALNETVLQSFDDAYEPVFAEAQQLTDEEVETIKEAYNYMLAHSVYDQVGIRAKASLEKRLAISTNLAPTQFLRTLLKDYNYFNGRLE